MSEQKREKKERNAVWLYPSITEQIELQFREDNCRSHSEFIEKAVRFYLAYIAAGKAANYLSVAVRSVIEGTLECFENRIARLLFKQAVELDIMSNILAYDTEISQTDLEKLRGKCVYDVKRTNGQIGFKDALKYQKTI